MQAPVNSYVKSVITYGAEIWCPSPVTVKWLNRMQTLTFRHLLRAPRDVSDKAILAEVGLVPIETSLHIARIKHVLQILSKPNSIIYHLWTTNRRLPSALLRSQIHGQTKEALLLCDLDYLLFDNEPVTDGRALFIKSKKELIKKAQSQTTKAIKAQTSLDLFRDIRKGTNEMASYLRLPDSPSYSLHAVRTRFGLRTLVLQFLPVFTKRRTIKDRHLRLCDRCDMQATGDPTHILLICPSIIAARTKALTKAQHSLINAPFAPSARTFLSAPPSWQRFSTCTTDSGRLRFLLGAHDLRLTPFVDTVFMNATHEIYMAYIAPPTQ